MPQGLYLYCLARLSRLPALPLAGPGVDGRNSLAVATYQDLAAVWSPVSVEDFCGPEAEERLRDLTWIGPRVIRHQEVVAGVMRHSPVLPVRFGTIFASRANLDKVLQRHSDTIAEYLERLTDQEEWAVKGMLDRPGAREKLFSLKLTREAESLEALSPGKRYFEEQRLRTAGDQELQRWLQRVCREVWANLWNYAAQVQERRRLSREATGSDQDMVWNWALLIPRQAVGDFKVFIRDVNAQYAHRGLSLEATGPWPPYSFCPTLDMEPEA
ncbi:MAG: GvpL/GvpF family gas vesicle protein [Deltaproteobacteria bacterium]|nr:GvpL/GvpF family gas vesicle protein [Deltaproteobacteria bacterium]